MPQFRKKDNFDAKNRTPDKIQKLAERLTLPGNYYAAINKFNNAEGGLRDISGYTLFERSLILDVVSGKISNLSSFSLRDTLQKGARNFSLCMQNPKSYHINAGWNFLIYTLHDWQEDSSIEKATDVLNDCFKDKFSADILEIFNYYNDRPNERANAHEVIVRLADDPKYANRIGYFLAVRSELYEQRQNHLYGGLMTNAKMQINDKFLKEAHAYSLPKQDIKRTLIQLDKTCFSAFDHLYAGVTVDDSNSYADYEEGTFRVELKYDGNPDKKTRLYRKKHYICLSMK